MPKEPRRFEFAGPPAAGDQPKAIASLVEGLQKGEKKVTLLGITGSGKSVAWDEPVTVQTQAGLYRGPIGALVDGVIGVEQFAETVEALPPGLWRVLAWDPKTGKSGWQLLTAVSRHAAPEQLFQLTTRCGRSVTVTGDHSVWVLRDGTVQLIPGSAARPGDALPVPRQLPAPTDSLKTLPLLELLDDYPTLFAFATPPPPTDKSYWLARHDEEPMRPITESLCQAIGALVADEEAHSKHLPRFWPALGQEHLAALLRGYFEGDGGVEENAVTAVSLHPELIAELAEALLRFGILARIRQVTKKKPDGSYGRYAHLAIYGAENLARFAERIGFVSQRKTVALQAQCGKRANTNVDLIYGVGPALRALRRDARLSQEQVAARAQCSQPMICAIESGQRQPSRTLFLRLCAALAAPPTLSSLAETFWAPIATVTPTAPTTPFVYDFSVAGVETFLTGRGGLFVHNTHAVARVIEQLQRPTLVIAHNKTLVAQLCSEFREFFPNNAVEYFVSYFDYYQPEAYIPQTDTFIEKDSSVNEEINRLRHAATQAVLERRDVIVVASVSCIYGLGSPQEYKNTVVWFHKGQDYDRDEILRRLITMQFSRNDIALTLGTFRVKGDTLEIQPANEEIIYRIEFDWDTVSRISAVDPVTGETRDEREELSIFPATHWVSAPERVAQILEQIESEMEAQVKRFEQEGKLIEAQRIRQRTNFDMEMIRELGFCSGIENYSRWFDDRPAGSPPNTLLEYFPDDMLIVIDESHQTIPQLNAMYAGDKRRKDTLIEYGFRLPSAGDNRPLRFQEFEQRAEQLIFVSATPGPYERQHSSRMVEQIIRPTGLVDPEVLLRPTRGQIDDLIGEIRGRIEKSERILVTTLTKKMAEDLTEYLVDLGIKVQYLHSDVHTLERTEILRDLRLGVYDVVVGINLLREGLDLPEVSLVAILDADKEGFLRSETSLIQTIGRAARNVGGQVLMYADTVTGSMQRAIDETNRRRALQLAHNQKHGITPQTIKKAVRDVLEAKQVAEAKSYYKVASDKAPESLPLDQLLLAITDMEKEMKQAARNLDFEHAALLRDEIGRLKKILPADAKKK